MAKAMSVPRKSIFYNDRVRRKKMTRERLSEMHVEIVHHENASLAGNFLSGKDPYILT